MTARIVLIDDDLDFTGLVTELFQDYGWETVVCNDDRQALQCVYDSRPDVVLLDVRMSTRQSGWNLLECLQSEPSTKSIPVLVCTAALDDLSARHAWLQERGVRSLVKPFDVDDLLRLVESMLKGGADDGRSEHAPSNGGTRRR